MDARIVIEILIGLDLVAVGFFLGVRTQAATKKQGAGVK